MLNSIQTREKKVKLNRTESKKRERHIILLCGFTIHTRNQSIHLESLTAVFRVLLSQHNNFYKKSIWCRHHKHALKHTSALSTCEKKSDYTKTIINLIHTDQAKLIIVALGNCNEFANFIFHISNLTSKVSGMCSIYRRVRWWIWNFRKTFFLGFSIVEPPFHWKWPRIIELWSQNKIWLGNRSKKNNQ